MVDGDNDMPVKRGRLRALADESPLVMSKLSTTFSKSQNVVPSAPPKVAAPATYIDTDSEHEEEEEDTSMLKDLGALFKEAGDITDVIIDKLGGSLEECTTEEEKAATLEHRKEVESWFERGYFRPFKCHGKIPENLQKQRSWDILKDYQQAGVMWMSALMEENQSFILADEMGLGKTAQTCVLLDYILRLTDPEDDSDEDEEEEEEEEEDDDVIEGVEDVNGEDADDNEYDDEPAKYLPALILVPRNLIDNWQVELKRWAPQLRVLVIDGSANERNELLRDVQKGREDPHVLLTTINFARGKDSKLRKLEYSIIVIDEAHSMKSAESQQAKGLRLLKAAKGRIFLTGTPVQNSARELTTLYHHVTEHGGTVERVHETMEVLTAKMMKVFKQQRSTLYNEKKRVKTLDSTDGGEDGPARFQGLFRTHKFDLINDIPSIMKSEQILHPDGGPEPAVWALQRLMQPRVLRRLKEDVLNDKLPPKEVIVEPLKMTPFQTYLYATALASAVVTGEDGEARKKQVEEIRKKVMQQQTQGKSDGIDIDLDFIKQVNSLQEDEQELLKQSPIDFDKSDLSSMVKVEEPEEKEAGEGDGAEDDDGEENKKSGFKKPGAKRGAAAAKKADSASKAANDLINPSSSAVDSSLDGSKVVNSLLHRLQRILCHPVLLRSGHFTNAQRDKTVDVLLRYDPFFKGSDRKGVTDYVHGLSDFDLHKLSEEFPDKLGDLCLPDKAFLTSAKMNRAIELIRESVFVRKEKLLIFSRFRMVHDVMAHLLYKLHPDVHFAPVHGQISPAQRTEIINAFQNDTSFKNLETGEVLPAPTVLLLTTQVGGQGLNLVAARECVLYDMDWNPQNDRQAEARIHRLGQTRPVIVRKLLCEGTVESRVFEVCSRKLKLDSKFGGKAEDVSKEVIEALKQAKTDLLKDISSILADGPLSLEGVKKQINGGGLTP